MSNSTKDMQKMQKLEQLTQAMVQNGTPASTVVEIIEQESFVQIKDALRKAELKTQEFEKHMEEMKAQQQQQALQMQDQMQDKKHAYDLELIDRKGEWDLRKAEMTAYAIDEGDDTAEIQKVMVLGVSYASPKASNLLLKSFF